MINIPLAAEPIFSIGMLPITNSMVNTWIALALFVIASFFLRKTREIPRGFQNFVEFIIESILDFFDRITGSREKSEKFFPLAGTLFLFILLSNWMGLFPGTGSIGVWHVIHGESELVPLLRPATSDLNLTLAMAMFSVVGSHLLGIFSVGLFTHASKFVQLAGIWKAIKTLNPIKVLVSLVEFVVGLIEFVGEMAKLASLSLRLFGNIFAGEVLITVIGSLASFVVPIPFMALELIVGLVQATVFAVLTVVYLTQMTSLPHGQEEHAVH